MNVSHTSPGSGSSPGAGTIIERGRGSFAPPYTWRIVEATIVGPGTLAVLWHGRTAKDRAQLLSFRQLHTETRFVIPPQEVGIVNENRVTVQIREGEQAVRTDFDFPAPTLNHTSGRMPP